MKKKSALFIALLSLCSLLFALSNDSDIPALEPSKITELNTSETSILIKTDIQNVDIYINRIYKGKTNLTVSDLVPGFYTLELRKFGYEDKEFLIQVRRGYELEFFVQMTAQFATVNLLDISDEVSVLAVGAFSTIWDNVNDICKITIPAGKHEVQLKKFGYRALSVDLNLDANQVLDFTVQLEPAFFTISDFKANKTSFNPDYGGRLGECEFSFNVTANGSVDAIVYSEENLPVWETNLTSFTTWEQKFTWDGTDNRGRALPDGNYKAVLSDGVKTETVDIVLDRSVSYATFACSRFGLGIGNLPAVFCEKPDYVVSDVSSGVLIKNEKDHCTNTSGKVVYGFSKHYELSLDFECFNGTINNNVLQMGAGVKLFDFCNMGNGKFCYGGLVRYGTGAFDIYEYSGIDCGNGLGAGALFGFDFNKVYFGLASQFIASEKEGTLAFNDLIWTNGLGICLNLSSYLKIDAWGTLNSALNENWLNAVDTGVDILVMPAGSAFIIDLRFNDIVIIGRSNYCSCRIGLSYLF